MSWFEERQEKLKEKLWIAIDSLSDSEGFVLTATSEDITFTKVNCGGYEDHILELAPLVEAEVRSEVQQLYKVRANLITEQASLAAKVTHKKKELANIEAAIAKATGGA